MRLVVIFAGAALAAACQSEPEVDVKNASVGEVAQEVAEASRGGSSMIRPGKWESTMKIEALEAPGMPPQAREAMQQMNARNTVFTTCLTREEVQRPKEDFFAGKDNACRYDRFTMGDGKIDALMRCSRDGMDQVMELAGTYSADSYTMRMTSRTEGAPGPASDMTMRMRVDARRVGECTPSEAREG